MKPEQVVITRNLTKHFDNFMAVDHLNFVVNRGEVVGYLGPNGSGKTTTMRMLLGLLLPSEGEAIVLGYNPVPESEKVRAKVGYMSQKFALYTELTVRENLSFYAGVYGIRDTIRLESVIDLVGLSGSGSQRAGELPTGMRQRLALATAIVHRPELLFLDEPTSGVDPNARRLFWDLIYELVEQGITAIVTTHYMDEAEYCERVGIMQDGQLLAYDSPYKLKENIMPGSTWDLRLDPAQVGNINESIPVMIAALEYLQKNADVIRAGLVSDHLRVVTPADISSRDLQNLLPEHLEGMLLLNRVSPTLEDVFLTLASNSAESLG